MVDKTFVIALGGNSITRAHENGNIEKQYKNLEQTADQLLELLKSNNRIVITHGNGPQVGNLLLAIETSKDVVPSLPLDICVAATEGFMGFMIQTTLANVLRKNGFKHNITTVISQVEVDKSDPAFKNPTKPVGPFYNKSDAQQLSREKGWAMIEDSHRGYRRVVPSPKPIGIQQSRIIKSMLDSGEIVIAVGGGGIPSVRSMMKSLEGVEAVIDKDYASSRLAIEIGADVLLFLTGTEYVFRDFGLPSQKPLANLNLADAAKMIAQGQFGAGSMEPKIEAAMEFIKERNGEAIITLPETAIKALEGKTGTRISRN